MVHQRLLTTAESVLIVIDVQDPFLDKLPPDTAVILRDRIRWLVTLATCLHIPVVATAESMPRLGSLTATIAAELPPDTVVHNKLSFNLAADPVILAAVQATGRPTAILVGLETDVCVAQSALGLLEHGYTVVAVADATGSPGTAHEFGLARMRDAGVLLISLKGLFYEWMRTVPETHRITAEYGARLGTPAGIIM